MSIAEKLKTVAENEQRVFDAGKRAEYDRFWDNYQDNGNRAHYRYAFYRPFWNDQNFKPKYNIVPSQDGQYIFQQCSITDMKGILERQGVALDFSRTPSLYHCFNSAKITRLPVIDGSNCGNWQNAFINCSSLQSIERIVVSENVGTGYFAQMFSGCCSLCDVIFDGVIGQDISLSDSLSLSKTSIESLFETLSETATGKTVSLSAKAIATAFGTPDAAEWVTLFSTRPNWSVTLI